ncbi:ESPR-type extended signal peptide-containing protein [Acinetobacter sp. 2019-01-05]|uniref:ESPR-type extended signal peptide-containing protein n=1 Tax=Acinetobacter sp. 2019-01-05 TaxID=3060565 RepID=UPI003977D89B
MNKIYKVIWNASLGIWVAVSEIAKGHSKTRSQRTDDALVLSTEVSNNNLIINPSSLPAPLLFRIKPLTWGVLTVLVPSITFGAVGVNGGALGPNGTVNSTAMSACTGTTPGTTTGQAYVGGDRSLAFGCGAVTDSDRDIAIGSQASTVNPANATGTYNESIAIGAQATASGAQAVALGGQTVAKGNSSVAIGADDMDKVASTNAPAFNYTPAAGDNAVYNNTATATAYKNLTGDYLVNFEQTNGGASAVGNRYTSVQTGEAAVAVGSKSTANDLGTALGPVATAGALASVALGTKADAEGQGSLSIGALAYTGKTGDVAVGINSAATGGDSIAIGAGKDLKSTAYVQSGATATQKGASASGANSISIGTNTAATGTNAVVVGTQSTASNLAVAVGSVATAGDQSVSIGSNSAASSQTSVAIGAGAQATLQNNSVALGSGSVADRASGSLGYDPLTETSTTSTNSTWKATDAAVSVGNGTTRTRQITSVAAGTNDTDAANVAQLKKATSKVLAGTGTTVAQGTDSNGITTYTVNANTFAIRQGTTNKATIGDNTNDKVSFINGKNTVAKVADELNSNTDVTFDLADDISLNSVTTGNTVLNSTGVTVNGGANGPVKLTNTGLDNGGNKIINVAAGTISSTSTDAVNGSQLNTTNQNVTTAQNTANTAVTNAAAAQATADKGLNFSVNGGTADNVKLGETVNFADGTNTTATYDPTTNTYKYSVNDNIGLTNAGSLTVGNTKVDNSGLTITGGPSVTKSGINAANQKITNVAAGTISSTSTDAVNGSQLNATNQNVTAAQNTANTAVTNAAAAQATADKGLNFSVNGGTADNVKLGETVNFADGTNTTATYDPTTNTYKYSVNDNIALTNAGSLTVGNTKVDNSGLTITGGPSVTTAGINAGNQKVTNVAAGTISSTSTDAVNGSQLNATNQNVTTAQNTANTAVTNAAAAQATADKGLNFSVNGGTADNVKLGETVNFADGTNTTATYDPTTNTYKYNVNDNIALTNAGSLTVGNTKVDNSGLTITGGPSVTSAGIDAGNQKITNVAAGTNPTDAVNVSQLGAATTAANTKTDALGTSTASNLGGGAVYNPVTGAVSSPIYTVNGNNVNNVGAAITALDKGWTLQSNGANAGAVKAGDTVDIGTATGETNLKVTKTGNNIQYGLNRDLNIDSVTAGDSKLDTNGLTITGGPSVTKSGINAANQKITNVAAGTISATSTDAVNGSQLNATNQNVTTAQNTANTAVTNAAAAQATADKGLNFSVNGGTAKNVKLGETVNFADGTNTTATYDPATNTYKYSVNDNIALTNTGSLTVGNTKVDNSGLTITGGPSVTSAGINAGNQKITNVAAGTNPTDAVNVSQLGAATTAANTKTDALGTSTASNLGGGAVYNPVTGAVSSPIYTVNGTNVNNVGAAISELDKGWTLQSNGSNAGAVKAGDTVDIGTVAGEANLKVTKTGNNIQYGLNRDLNIDSVTAGDSKLDTNGLTIAGGPSVTKSGINAANQKITNVTAGTISSTSTDAVNGSQLNATNQNVTTAQNTANTAVTNAAAAQATADKGLNFSVNGGTADNVKLGETVNFADGTNTTATYDPTTNTYKYSVNDNIALTNAGSLTVGNTKVDNSGLTITGGPSVTSAGINAGNQKVTNVAAGTISATSTDAVNGSQLNATNQNVTTAQNTANTAVTNAAAAQATADKGLNFSVNGGTADNVKLGETVNFADGTNTTATYDPTTNTYKYSVNDNIGLTNAGSLTVGNTKVDNSGLTAGNTKVDNSGLTITGGPSVTSAGINAGNQKITNVAAGTNPTDAVNVSQLGAVTTAANTKTDALGTSTANNLGGGAVYNPVTGAVSSPTYTVNGNNVNNVGAAITALDKGWTLQSNGANAGAVKAGDTVDIGTATGETNLKVTKTGNNIQYGLNRDLNIDSVTAGDSKLDTNGLTITGGPSVTKSGINAANQKITNVAAGTISATSTDAVNGSQLNTLDNRVTKNGDSTANIFGGGAKANPDGSISNPTYNVAGTSANNVGDALTALDKAVTDAGTAANAGWTVSANGDTATAKNIKPNGKVNFTGDDNLTVAQTSNTDNEGNIKVALNKNLKVDSVTTGTTVIDTTGVKVGDNVQLGATGLTIVGGPSIMTSGISAGNKVITNVAAGVNTTDAVNKGQLDSAITNINNNVGALANSAVQYDKNADGTVNKDSVTLAGGANGTALKNVANGTVAEGSKDAVNGGQLWNVQQQVDKNTGDISNLQNNINNGKTGLVQQADKDAAITVGKDTGGTQVNVAGKAGDRTVTGVKAGAVTESSKDAVNGSQLNATNQALVNALGGGAGYNNITESFSNPTYNVADKSYNNVGDAIGALNQADQTLNNKIDNVNNKLEQAFYATNQRIDNLEEKMSAGIAANAALENAPFRDCSKFCVST